MRYSIYKNKVLQDKRINKLNFTPDGRLYYVYRVTDLETKEYYYGSRVKIKENIEDDFWFYCTSSKRKNLIKENKEKYKLKIIKKFNNAADMIIYESFLHQYFNVKINEKFFNEANQTPFGFNRSGIKNSDETNEKISTAIKGKKKGVKFSKEHRDSLSNSRKLYYRNHPEARLIQSEIGKKNKGKKRTDETKNNMSIAQTGLKNSEIQNKKISKNSKSGTDSVKKKLSKLNSGAKHPQALKIAVYNNNNEIIFISEGTFKKDCEKQALPYNKLCYSYRQNKPLKDKKFFGWKAIILS